MEDAHSRFGCPKPHRFLVLEKETNVYFLIAPDSQVSLFPKLSIKKKSDGREQSQALVNSSGTIIPTFGNVVRNLDLGLGQTFSWKFSLVSYERPIIGRDFLSYFRLMIDFDKKCLLNPETGLKTEKISTAACECHYNEKSTDGWPPNTGILKRPVKHRFHVIDENTKMPFLVAYSSQISIFPRSKLKKDSVEPFNGSFEIVEKLGQVIQVLGWTTQTLNFGTKRNFTWKFAVADISKPIIGLDFLSDMRLTKQFELGYNRLFDVVTRFATLAPSGPCECGTLRDGWPVNTEYTIRAIYVSTNEKRFNRGCKSNLYPELGKRNFDSAQRSSQLSNRQVGPNNSNPAPSNQNPKKLQPNPRPFKRYFRAHKKNSKKLKEESKVTLKEETLKQSNKILKKMDAKCEEVLKEEFIEVLQDTFLEIKELLKEKSKELQFEKLKEVNERMHHFHVTDKNSNLLFLVGRGVEVSIFPKSLLEEANTEPFDSSFELVEMNGEVLQVLGWTTLTLDIGLEKEFVWKFIVINKFDKPILGADFIDHYRLTIQAGSLIDLETKKSTSPLGPCDCGKSHDGWPSMSSLKIRLLTPINESSSTEENSKNLQEELTEVSHTDFSSLQPKSEVKHRFHVTDKNTNLQFLIETAAEISVFPRSAVREEDMKPSNGFFELEDDLGRTLKILGWTTLTLDIGIQREFTIQFAVADIPKPIIGLNFLNLYGFSIFKECLIDPETRLSTPPPSEPCDCGKSSDGWATFSGFSIKAVFNGRNKTSESLKNDSKIFEQNCCDPGKTFAKFVEDFESGAVERTVSDSETLKTETGATEENSTKVVKDFKSKAEEKSVAHKLNEVSESLKDDFETLKKESGESEEISAKFIEDSESDLEERSVFNKLNEVSESLKNHSETLKEKKEEFEEDFETSTEDSDSSDEVSCATVIEKLSDLYEGNSQITDNESDEEKIRLISDKLSSINNSEDSVENRESEEETKETDNNSLKPVSHCFHVIDKNSKILFFVSEMAQISVFPRSQSQSYMVEDSTGSEFIDVNVSVLPIYGYVTLKLDFGLQRDFEWKFAVSDFEEPIIGRDFLNQFGLECDHTLSGSYILNPKTLMKSPELTDPCVCEKFINRPFLTNIRRSNMTSKMFPIQKKVEFKTHCELAADGRCPEEKHLILVDRETGMPYFMSSAAVSVFPKSEVNEDEIEAFDNSFDLINIMGSVIPIYGWITRKMDFGLGRYFVWKFAVINIGGPMLGHEFFQHYGFTVSYLHRNVFDYVTSKTVLGSKKFCQCQAKKYWPDLSSMKKRQRFSKIRN